VLLRKRDDLVDDFLVLTISLRNVSQIADSAHRPQLGEMIVAGFAFCELKGERISLCDTVDLACQIDSRIRAQFVPPDEKNL